MFNLDVHFITNQWKPTQVYYAHYLELAAIHGLDAPKRKQNHEATSRFAAENPGGPNAILATPRPSPTAPPAWPSIAHPDAARQTTDGRWVVAEPVAAPSGLRQGGSRTQGSGWHRAGQGPAGRLRPTRPGGLRRGPAGDDRGRRRLSCQAQRRQEPPHRVGVRHGAHESAWTTAPHSNKPGSALDPARRAGLTSHRSTSSRSQGRTPQTGGRDRLLHGGAGDRVPGVSAGPPCSTKTPTPRSARLPARSRIPGGHDAT